LATIVSVAAAGVLRYLKGPDKNFPRGCFFFLREDVVRIKRAFEKYAVPAVKYSMSGELIALRHAMKNYLGHDSGLAAVVRAVLDGTLAPVGYTKRFRGITGYLFAAGELRKYRPVPDVQVPKEGFVNYREAAAILGITVRDIRGLVAYGVLNNAAEYRLGLSKLLATREVQSLAENYVALSVLARRFHLKSRSFTRDLNESGTPMLAVPLPDAGRGHAFFLSKDVAAHIQIPSSRILEEAAQRRVKAAQKPRRAN
jgi:hypothetical protein